jgi:hypothetical protein
MTCWLSLDQRLLRARHGLHQLAMPVVVVDDGDGVPAGLFETALAGPRRGPGVLRERVNALLQSGEAAWCPAVRLELWRGVNV